MFKIRKSHTPNSHTKCEFIFPQGSQANSSSRAPVKYKATKRKCAGLKGNNDNNNKTLLAGKNLNPALMFDFEKQDVTGDFYTYRKGVYQEVDRKTGKIVESAEPLYHKVRKGESLSVIARKCGVSVNTLYRLNKLNSRSVLRIGQRIRYR